MKKKILFIYTNYSSFVKTDFEILSSEFEVVKYQFKPVYGIFKTGMQLIKQFIFLLFKSHKFDSCYIWFADYHSFLPVLFSRILNKKSFVVIGGYDVARIPNLNYGALNSKMRAFCAVYSMNNCTNNLTVSVYVDRKVKWIAKKAKTKMIYNCVDLENTDLTKIEKENLILTVGIINSEKTYYLKGIDTFIEVAQLLPENNFMLVGAERAIIENLTKNIPDNLQIIGRTNHDELVQYYKKAKIYCQFSRSESFGVSIVEAMNFGCYPIVTNVGGMPEIVISSGKILQRDNENIVSEINWHLKNSLGFNTEKNISRFNIKIRKKEILKSTVNQ